MMTITVNNEITGGKALEYSESIWTGRRSIKYDGKALRRDNNKTFVLEGDEPVTFSLKGNRYTGLTVTCPLLTGTLALTKKLPVYAFILSVLVLLPGILFGAIGGAIGGVLAYINLEMMTRISKTWLKVIISIEMMIISAGVSFGLAWLIGGWFF